MPVTFIRLLTETLGCDDEDDLDMMPKAEVMALLNDLPGVSAVEIADDFVYKVQWSTSSQGSCSFFDTREQMVSWLNHQGTRDHRISMITRFRVADTDVLRWNRPEPFLSGE